MEQVVAGGQGRGKQVGNCLMGKGFYFGVMEMFWNQIEVVGAQIIMNVLNTTELFTLKWWILCHVISLQKIIIFEINGDDPTESQESYANNQDKSRILKALFCRLKCSRICQNVEPNRLVGTEDAELPSGKSSSL